MNEVVVEAQMMIRRPVAVVFEAFVNPDITTSFWFTKSSGRLALGKKVIWEWEMYGVATEVEVLEVVPNQQIRIQWETRPQLLSLSLQEWRRGIRTWLSRTMVLGKKEKIYCERLSTAQVDLRQYWMVQRLFWNMVSH